LGDGHHTPLNDSVDWRAQVRDGCSGAFDGATAGAAEELVSAGAGGTAAACGTGDGI